MLKKSNIKCVDRSCKSGPVAHGMQEFRRQVSQTGAVLEDINHWSQAENEACIVTGLTSDRMIQRLLDNQGISFSVKAEGVVIDWCKGFKNPVLVIAGTDEKGLMYALLEMAERVRTGGLETLNQTTRIVEYPDHIVRGVNRFIMGQLDESWFYSDDFWHYYFSLLARCRYNRFVLITGFDTAYMSPPYSYFVDVPGFSNVKVRNQSADQQEKNLLTLKKIGQLCHNYGLEFVFAIWQQKPWTDVQDVLVEGLKDDEAALSEYCAEGVKALLNACEEIDCIHFRVNHEAGVGTQITNEDFWKSCIDAVADVADTGRDIKLALRAKGLTDEMITHAEQRGLNIEVPTKYWCEHSGLPHHLTQMRQEELTQLDNFNHSRRYSYADMQKKPYWYDLVFRLWNYGSTCMFLWGDPDYVRRFSQSCLMGNSIGFEIGTPLSLKGGHAMIQANMEPWFLFNDPDLRHYEWEDERYWMWYLVFGRIGYNQSASEEIWLRELAVRFGQQATPHIAAAYRAASKIIPLITAFHMPVHPQLCYWPEISTGGALFGENNVNSYFKDVTYGSSEPSDGGLFYKITDYVEDKNKDSLNGKYTPDQVQSWLSSLVYDLETSLEKIDDSAAMSSQAEFEAMKIDFDMLIDLAIYHQWKVQAAKALSEFSISDQKEDLVKTYQFAVAARDTWQRLLDRGEKAYHHTLEFGAGSGLGRSGHWRDYVIEAEKDLEKLTAMLISREVQPEHISEIDLNDTGVDKDWVNQLSYSCSVPADCQSGEALVIKLEVSPVAVVKNSFTLHYRHVNQLEGAFKTIKMVYTDAGYVGTIPAAYITPEWDLMVYFSAVSAENRGILLPGLYHAQELLPYYYIKVN